MTASSTLVVLWMNFSTWNFSCDSGSRIRKYSQKLDKRCWTQGPPHLSNLIIIELHRLHTVSFDWFLSGLEWILNLEFCLLKLLIFYQKLLWHIRSRLNSSTFWVFRPVFRYVWSKLKLCAKRVKFLIQHIQIQAQKLKMWKG